LDVLERPPEESLGQGLSPSEAAFARRGGEGAGERPAIALQTKLTLGFALIALIAAALIAFALFLNIRLQLRRDIADRLRDAVAIGALQVDGDLHATLTDPAQEDGPDYTRIKHVLQNIRDAGVDYRYVYSMRMVNGQATFIVDAETDPELISHLGDIYDDLQPNILAQLNCINELFVDLELATDQWGTWMTGFAPIYTSDGRVEAVLGIDIAADNVLQHERQILGLAAVIYAILIPIVVFLAWLLAASLTAPIAALIEARPAHHRRRPGPLRHRPKP
jgi:hypothetical protein